MIKLLLILVSLALIGLLVASVVMMVMAFIFLELGRVIFYLTAAIILTALAVKAVIKLITLFRCVCQLESA